MEESQWLMKNFLSPSSSLTQGISNEIAVESELTNKFLRGEISFADYSVEWYGEKNDEDSDDMDVDDQDEEQLTAEPINKIVRRRKLRLSPALIGLMGEANIRFVRGEKDIAEKMCHEIIKQCPRAPEPYQTLAQIYESDPDKSLQFSLLAAHLGPPDADEWLRLAAISKQRNDVKQEMLCLSQAIKARPQCLALHLKQLDLLNSLDELNYPVHTLKINRLKCYHKIVSSLPASEGETIMNYAKKAATLYHNDNEIDKALEVMNIAYEKCSSLFTSEDINLYLELLISQKQYETCIDVFVVNAGVEIEAEVQTISENGQIKEHTNYLNCCIPNELPIDLKSKLLVCLVHLGAIGLVHTLLQSFLNNDVDKAPDLYMDIEEALSSVGEHELALKLLEPLVKSENFDLGAIWLKHAECLYNLHREDEAIDSYFKVLEHAPQHIQARKRLFTILEKKGCIEDALNVLQQDYKLIVSGQLLYEQCMALKKYNRMLKYLETGEALLSKTFVRFRHQEELKIARMYRTGLYLIHNFRSTRGENIYNQDDLQFDEDESFKLSATQEWELFNELLKLAHQYKKYSTMQRLTFGAIMSKNLNSHRQEIEFLCLQSSLLNKDYKNAYPLIREFVIKFPNQPQVWNLLNVVAHEKNNFGKILSRLFQKDDNIIKYLFFGNSYLVSGRYLVALKNFLLYHEQQTDSLSSFLVGITLLIMAAQRTVDKHHNLILQGVSYLLTYQHLRKWDHEFYYNFGRAFQMLNVNNLAIEYYEKALKCGGTVKCENHGCIDLVQETAFNLYILYKEHSPHLARMYLEKYLIV